MIRLVLLAALIALLSACASAPPPTPTTAQVIEAFKKAGLEVGEARSMTQEDYVPAAVGKEGMRFFIPSMGSNSGGRVMRYETTAQAEKTLGYFAGVYFEGDKMVSSQAFMKDTVVVQLSGDVPIDKVAAYKAALNDWKP